VTVSIFGFAVGFGSFFKYKNWFTVGFGFKFLWFQILITCTANTNDTGKTPA